MSVRNSLSSASRNHVCINYLDFLAASCKKRWSFVDAIYGVMPIFGMVTKNPPIKAQNCADDLRELALQVLSTQVSDEINIARLIALAEQLHITRFDILLPYSFSEKQLDNIRAEYVKPLSLQLEGDRLSVGVAAGSQISS
ncbi:hypothetical protein BL250_11905 [Erwinia sp. OLTSP20]|uniref:hypothetical protein n=1 Tax=unclassified Erwinia TaxID=2622719 RepID=UPI000C184D60|nr:MULTISPECIES: hypothetical protein [unclassified Erwinia]PIJ49513.1 hypothetical protein BV501_12395 [Erwinia sp. OAMSP11]PIJ71179.1 hypothetical protein BK416_11875 [Erwinia sp. OLSSP12]PIJ79828.1 hypothetical protein BLD47_12645 [Erwinia sp. OLCASP19]PIJ81591.1 hypothetical protein BLD46_12490 [Erwinia sp. OLMTSP26]PIJ84006.1 hypothetical protein BLD49_12585 [Erwinia sp. OLMDSP33]